MEANLRAFKAGFHFGETAELFESSYEVKPAMLEPGEYVNITGNTATAWGLIAASTRSGLPLFLGTYPITPASDILHELSKHKQFGVRTFQAEDEISGIGAALGAAFGGALGVTTTSGPGIDLKSETMGLAISLELPLLIIDIQRGGPSTGLPTKTEQADLLHAMYGRHGEAPLPIVAAKTPSHCFEATLEAVRLAVKYRTPVILLSDGYLANGTEPWRLPDMDDLPDIDPDFATATNHTDADGNEVFWPYVRDEDTLARPWAPPGVPGLEHRIGGLEKSDGSGNVAYDGPNHERMTRLRAAKIAGIANDIPPTDVDDEEGAEVLVIGWGSTYGAIAAGVQRVRARGHKVAQAHLVHLNPFPADLGEVLRRYQRVLVPEVNLGQLSRLLRAEYLVDAISFTQVQGIPFRAAAMEAAILQQIEGSDRDPLGADAEGSSPGRGPTVTGPLRPTGPRQPERCPTDDRPRQRRRDLGPGPAHHPQGLVLRSGGPLVPRVRRLLDPRRRADAHARARRAPGEHGLPVRHRLRGPVPVLHEHLRDALHPRPGAGHRHRAGHHPARSRRLGGHR